MRRYILLLIVGLFLTSFVTASLGTVKMDDCIDLYQFCDNCTYVNYTNMKYPNGTVSITNDAMTKTNFNYNYTFCNTDTLGEHFYTVCGDKDGNVVCEEIGFEVTTNGDNLEDSDAMLYLGMLFLLVALFIFNIYGITKVPNGRITDDYGQLIGIDKLKYVKYLLFAFGWGLLIGISYITSNVALAYLHADLIGQFFFMIYKLLMNLTLPIVAVTLVVLLINIFKDAEVKRLLDRGIVEDYRI